MILDLTAHSILRLQALQQGIQRAATNFFAVGDDLYYVMREQQGGAAGDPPPYNELNVYKSSDKLTWSLIATAVEGGFPSQDNDCSDAPSVLVGSLIFTLVRLISVPPDLGPPVQTLLFHVFDTGTDAFLVDGTPSDMKGGAGFSIDNTYSASAFNNGDLLVTCTAQPGGPFTTQFFQIQLYHPLTDTWDSPIDVDSSVSQVIQQTHDPSSDFAFVFYQKGSTKEIRCLTVADSMTYTDATVVTLGSGNPPPSQNAMIGQPCITTDTNEVVLPWRDHDVMGAPQLKVSRATIAGTPSFSTDVVEDNSTLPSGYSVQGWDQAAAGAWYCQDIGGLLYAFYAVDNGDLDSSSSQSFLYYRWSTAAGTWSDAHIGYSSAVPGEMLNPYGTKLSGFDPVILVNIIDPTLFPLISGLTSFILYPGEELSNEFK